MYKEIKLKDGKEVLVKLDWEDTLIEVESIFDKEIYYGISKKGYYYFKKYGGMLKGEK